jgi:hypothetical protein
MKAMASLFRSTNNPSLKELSAVILVCFSLASTFTPGASAQPVMRVVKQSDNGIQLLVNGGFEQLNQQGMTAWAAWQGGFREAAAEGRAGSRAVVCERGESGKESGASQTLVLNRTNIAPLVVRGWSKADSVSGSADSGYSLYLDIVYRDGTPLWGRTANFQCGTHDWQEVSLVLLPDKPVKSVTLHCLFRGHTGKVWFDDVTLHEVPTPAGAVLFQGAAVEKLPTANTPTTKGERQKFATQDGLEITCCDNSIVSLNVQGRELAAGSPSGFLARDFAANSDVFAFTNGRCADLGLDVQTRFSPTPQCVMVDGSIADTTGKDRAVTLLFALPVDATGWTWADDVRQTREIAGTGEFANTINLRCGANGKMSKYPLGAIWNEQAGLGLCVDMEKPSQYRIVYHAGTKQFFLAWDLGLSKETAKFPSRANFRFAIFSFEPAQGFRGALQKFYALFPQQFVKRVRSEGTWMPFTDIAKVPGFADFGFGFQEGAPNVRFDDDHGIASFFYVEPMSYWLSLPADVPRTYDAALSVLNRDLAGDRDKDKQQMAGATLSSGIHGPNGQLALYLVKAPWCDGGVFTLNPDPDLSSGSTNLPTKASVMWEAIDQCFKKNAPPQGTAAPGAGLDGVYLDSLEMSATELDYSRDHFASADVPLVFDQSGRVCRLMMFSTWEFARELARRMHSTGKLTFANAVLWNYSFPAALLDVMGTEVNWLHQGQYAPDTDATMNFRRALCRQKPYCLLMNTDYTRFTPALVENYFQRCLFYGVWPGFFDQEAASKDPYWVSEKKWYERDRSLFQKYIPLLKQVTSAGWQPVTRASTDTPKVWLERFGEPSEGRFFLTALNDQGETQRTRITLDKAISSITAARDLITGKELSLDKDGRIVIELPTQGAALIQLTR